MIKLLRLTDGNCRPITLAEHEHHVRGRKNT
jgi:hypothetical protein